MMWVVGSLLWLWMFMVLAMGIILFGGLYVYDKICHAIVRTGKFLRRSAPTDGR